MGYDRIRPSLDIESNLKSGIVRGGRSADLNGNPKKRPLSEVERTGINGPQYVVRPLIAKKRHFGVGGGPSATSKSDIKRCQ